jgi:N-acetylglucosaminyldiphosphoundecaprenol N-acetyl-beta-D-mannosaminyltransferase
MTIKKLTTGLCNLDNLTLSQAITAVSDKSQEPGLSIVVTPNIDHLSRLCDEHCDPEFKQVYEQSDLCLCDSNIFEKLLRMKGHQVAEVVAGSTLTEALFKQQLSSEDKVMIIGGEQPVIEQLRGIYPSLNLQHYNPPMGFINKPDEVEKTLVLMEQSEAKYFFVAVGSPRQEMLAQRLKQRGKAQGVALCIGASILFLVGEEKRAPILIQKLHLEWFYRMIQNPGVLAKRYFNNFLDLPRIYRGL